MSLLSFYTRGFWLIAAKTGVFFRAELSTTHASAAGFRVIALLFGFIVLSQLFLRIAATSCKGTELCGFRPASSFPFWASPSSATTPAWVPRRTHWWLSSWFVGRRWSFQWFCWVWSESAFGGSKNLFSYLVCCRLLVVWMPSDCSCFYFIYAIYLCSLSLVSACSQ